MVKYFFYSRCRWIWTLIGIKLNYILILWLFTCYIRDNLTYLILPTHILLFPAS